MQISARTWFPDKGFLSRDSTQNMQFWVNLCMVKKSILCQHQTHDIQLPGKGKQVMEF